MDTQITNNTLSPADLISAVQLRSPPGIVKVRGKVTRLYNHTASGYVYGDLASLNDDCSISFRCPEDAAPSSHNQLVIIEGGLRLKAAYQAPGFNLEITGSCTGNFKLPKVQTTSVPERAAKLPLQEFLEKKASYALIGSGTGINDTIQAGATPQWQSAQSQSDSSSILNQARVFKEKGAKAIFFVRGGADPTLELWNSPEFVKGLLELETPFYTALGHSDFISLADQCADYSYRTPDHLGEAIKQGNRIISQQENLKRTIKELNESKSGLSSELNIAKEKLQQFQIDQINNEKLKDKESLNKKENLINNKIWVAIAITSAIISLFMLGSS